MGGGRNRQGTTRAKTRPRVIDFGFNIIKDVTAGLIASVVLIGNMVSFGALMFPGELSAGIPVAIWAMLIGGCVGGVWMALSTSIAPLATGIDSPTGAALVLLGALTASDVQAAGGSLETAVQIVMLVFTMATVLCGIVFYGLGAFRFGSYFRFVPYPVVGGFLAATGFFLIAGAVRMTSGPTALTLGGLEAWTVADAARLAAAAVVVGVMVRLRRRTKAPFAMPVALIAMWLVNVLALHVLQLSGAEHGWYLPSLGMLPAWLPFHAVHAVHLNWLTLGHLGLQLVAVTIIALISLVTKVTSIEVGRQVAGDLNREFRGQGIGSLLAAPLGGITCSPQVSTSRFLDSAGSGGRLSGVVCALTFGFVGLANLDLPSFIPIPIIAGMVLYLGYVFIVDALWRPFVQRAWVDLALSLAVMFVCIRYGYVVGVMAGVVCACLLFVVGYARLDVVRRHLNGAQFSSHVDRSAEASAHLRAVGDAVQLYWLSGHIFFGTSEKLFERIRDDVQAALPRRTAYLILDFGLVSGADSSTYISLAKLRNFCDQHSIAIFYCSLQPAHLAALERGGFIGADSPHQACADVDAALAWCEDKLLAEAGIEVGTSDGGFISWLQRQLGEGASAADLIAYFDRNDVTGSTVLQRQGEAAETIDIVADGRLAIDVATKDGKSLRVRRIATHTVVGEMGFFRHSVRSASVSAEERATVFTLTRVNFERMRRERPDLANVFDEFMIRIIADRLDNAYRKVAALGPLAS